MSSTEPPQQEIDALRQRVAELETALLSSGFSAQHQDVLEALRNSQHKLSFLVEGNPLGVISWNTAFEVTDWNPAAEAICGYSYHEALGRHAAGLLVAESSREAVNQAFAALLKQDGGIH